MDARVAQLMKFIERDIKQRVDLEGAQKQASAQQSVRQAGGFAVLTGTEDTKTAQRGFITGDYVPVEVSPAPPAAMHHATLQCSLCSTSLR